MNHIRSAGTDSPYYREGDRVRGNCQSVFVSLKDGHDASFYYSYLRANRRDGERLMLMHVSAMIAISGPAELLPEAPRLVSQQRLAGVRDGEEGLVVEIEWTESMND